MASVILCIKEETRRILGKNREDVVMRILVTGGAGYIGSHTCVELLNAGHEVVVVDNLCNSSEKSLERVEKITGKPVTFYKADILDRDALEEIFTKEKIDSCIHFAGLKAVGESVEKPIEYYHNNITGTLILLKLMKKYNCKKIVFSSSATVYGNPKELPIKEDFPLSTTIHLPIKLTLTHSDLSERRTYSFDGSYSSLIIGTIFVSLTVAIYGISLTSS